MTLKLNITNSSSCYKLKNKQLKSKYRTLAHITLRLCVVNSIAFAIKWPRAVLEKQNNL